MIHGDVRPKYISLQTTEQPNKLNDRLGDPYSPNKVQINHLKKQNAIYMAPILFKSLALKKRKIKHNPYKSEVFSLGMVILETGLLKSVQEVYDLKEKKIKVDKFLELIDEFMEIYGQIDLLRESMVWFLDLNGKSRNDPKTLIQMFLNLKNELYGNLNPDRIDSQQATLQTKQEQIDSFHQWQSADQIIKSLQSPVRDSKDHLSGQLDQAQSESPVTNNPNLHYINDIEQIQEKGVSHPAKTHSIQNGQQDY